MTATAVPTTFPCPRCGNLLTYGQLACPRCGGLVYTQQLNEIAAAAQREEAAGNAVRAALIWQQALPLLPPDSQQYRMVTQRIGALTAGIGAGASPYVPRGVDAPATQIQTRPPDPLPLALAKTIGSMVISIIVYTLMWKEAHGLTYALKFATGFCLLMLIHELGHVFAMRYFGLSASPPIFIPFLGALINLRQMPRNALEEAVVGIGGPVTGTIGAAITYWIYLRTGSHLMLELARFGFLLNLFNMLPVPPLDGGRITAAVSPFIWIPGLLLAAALIAFDYFVLGQFNPILILLLVMAWPRIKRVLIDRQHNAPYYQIGWKATWAMGIAYVLLGGFLAVMTFLPVIEMILGRRAG